MKNIRYILSLIFVLISFSVWAQTEQTGFDIIESIVESYSDSDDDIDITDLVEKLEFLLENPLNINSANNIQLEDFPFLSSYQIENLLRYRDKVGQLYSVFELLGVDGFNQETIDKLQPFIAFLSPETETKTYWKQEINMRYTQKLEEDDDFVEDENGETNYLGIKPTLLLKYKAQKGDKIQFGVNAENDSGEEFFSGNNKYGFDFYSAYFGYHGKNHLKQLYVGNYQARFGQGLIQWSNYGIRKSANSIKIRQTGQGLKTSSSTEENKYLQGIATNLVFNNFQVIGFYSYANVDANISEYDIDSTMLEVSSLQTSGYHRTISENIDENALTVQKAGACFKYRFNQLSVAVNGVYQHFNEPLVISDQAYNKFNFSGQENYNISTDFLWIKNKFNLFGEAGISQSGGKGIVAGVEAFPTHEVTLSVLYRNYEANFQPINGNSFSESSKNTNEKGIYAGIFVYPIKHIKLSGYIDNYQSHWIKYTSYGPVRGTDIVTQLDYTPTRHLSMYARYKNEINSKKTSKTSPIKDDEEQRLQHARFHLSWNINDKYSLRYRAEWSNYSKTDTIQNGWLTYVDFIAKPFEKFSASARFERFNTQGYDSRIYAYENDVPLYFYIPGFSGNGMRYYLNLKYKVLPKLTLYVKASQTMFIEEDSSVVTSETTYADNHVSEVKVHLKYRF